MLAQANSNVPGRRKPWESPNSKQAGRPCLEKGPRIMQRTYIFTPGSFRRDFQMDRAFAICGGVLLVFRAIQGSLRFAFEDFWVFGLGA